MKKAFTMLELIFIIIVIGILAVVVLPRMQRDPLREAAIQLVSHIRYAQHLAMVDDQYDANDGDWYKNRWQLMFENSTNAGGTWSYTIFSDKLGISAGNAEANEIAINPSDKAKKMTGGTDGIHYDKVEASTEMNLGNKYGITNIAFSSSCQFSGSQRISFDHFGRPLKGNLASYSSPYPTSSRLLTSQCDITLMDGEGNITVSIAPETGYTFIK